MRIGNDIVNISRIEDPLRLARKILSKKEMEIFETKTNKQEFIAGRFAAKEAFMKAIGKGFAGISISEIEVLYDEDGAPYIFYKDKTYSCSISHDGGIATAVVLFE